MMFVRLWVVAAVVACAAFFVTLTGWMAWHQHGRANHVAGLLQKERDVDRRYAARRIPAPQMRTVSTYPAPYNLEIICTVSGSTGAGDPLDPDVGPKPGDLYVKTCRAKRLEPTPSG